MYIHINDIIDMEKRNITVREKKLIDKLNNKVIGVDLGKEGEDKTVKTTYNSYGNVVKQEILERHTEIKDKDTRVRTPEQESKKEQVNHPDHYNDYDVEVIEMMERVFGHEAVINFCRLNAFKYRMRAGHKDGNSLEQDLKKERWYLDYIKNHS